MATLYLAIFVIGFALTMISFLTGVASHSFGHFGDVGHGGDAGHGADTGDAHGDHGQRPHGETSAAARIGDPLPPTSGNGSPTNVKRATGTRPRFARFSMIT